MTMIRALPLVLALLGLTACETSRQAAAGDPPTSLDTWEDKVQVVATPDEIRLAPHDTGLSGAQARALSELHARWAQAQGDVITIAAPAAGGAAASVTSYAARDYLIGQGVPAAAVSLVGYDAAPGSPVVVGYATYEALPLQCGEWTVMTASFHNRPYANFGCAIAANMAAQVADPRDLVQPRTQTPADAQRRDVMLGKYRAGELTASARDDASSGAISTAVN